MSSFLQLCALIAILLDGIEFKIGPIDMNAERGLVPVIIAYLAVSSCLGRRAPSDNATLCYLAWVFVLIIAGMFSTSPLSHVSGFLISVAPFFYYLLFRATFTSSNLTGSVLEVALWFTAISGMLIFFIYSETGYFATFTDRGRLALFMREPNILGATIGAMMLAHYGFFQRRPRHFLLHGLSLIALACTFSKTPYLAAAAGAIYYLMAKRNYRSGWAKLLAISIVTLVALGLLAFSAELSQFYVSYLQRPDAISNRMFALVSGWHRFLNHPLIGNGPLDFSFANKGMLAEMGTDSERNMWIWQMVVAILHDSGVLGALFFFAFLFFAWRRGMHQANCGHDEYYGYAAALLAILICSQLTTLHLSAIFGVATGIMSSGRVRNLRTRHFGSEDAYPNVGHLAPDAP